MLRNILQEQIAMLPDCFQMAHREAHETHYRYNLYSNWGWELDTTVSGASGLSTMYDVYPYTTTDPTSAIKNLKNNLIDYNNNNTTLSRTASSIDGDWTNDNGIMYKNLDYQIRKGLSI